VDRREISFLIKWDTNNRINIPAVWDPDDGDGYKMISFVTVIDQFKWNYTETNITNNWS